MTRLFLLSLILLLHNIVGHAQDLKLEIIPLRHRLTDEVLPVLLPLVAPGGTLSGMNNQLIIRTTETNLAELKQVLARIDQAARRLKIYVRQDVAGTGQVGEQSLSGRYRSGEVGVEVPGRGRDGLSVSAGNGNEVRYRTYSHPGGQRRAESAFRASHRRAVRIHQYRPVHTRAEPNHYLWRFGRFRHQRYSVSGS